MYVDEWLDKSVHGIVGTIPLTSSKLEIPQRYYEPDGSIEHGSGNGIDALSYAVWVSDVALGGLVLSGLPFAIRAAITGETVISGNILPKQYDHETRSDYPVIIKHGYKLADAITTIFTLGF